MYVREVMTPRFKFLMVSSTTTLDFAGERMVDQGVGSVVVMDESGVPVGLITKTDFISALATGIKISSTRVQDLMSPLNNFVTPDTKTRDAAILMVQNNCHHLIVRDESYDAIGIVSTKDLADDTIHQPDACPFLALLPKVAPSKRKEFEDKVRFRYENLKHKITE